MSPYVVNPNPWMGMIEMHCVTLPRRSADRFMRVLVAVLVSLQPACREAPPAAPVPGPAVAEVPLAETFQLSAFQLHYDEQDKSLQVSYEVHNRGKVRERSVLCADLIDQDGYFVEENTRLGRISLAAGRSTQAQSESFTLPSDWRDTKVLRVFVAAPFCSRDSAKQRSRELLLDKAGHPLPPHERPEGKRSVTREDGAPGLMFRLEDMQVTQNDKEELEVSYGVTNLAKGRASAKLCARLGDKDEKCPCGSLANAEEFSTIRLGLGGSERHRGALFIQDIKTWHKGRVMTLYLAPLGCGEPVEQAVSNVVTLPWPASLRSSVKGGGRKP